VWGFCGQRNRDLKDAGHRASELRDILLDSLVEAQLLASMLPAFPIASEEATRSDLSPDIPPELSFLSP